MDLKSPAHEFTDFSNLNYDLNVSIITIRYIVASKITAVIVRADKQRRGLPTVVDSHKFVVIGLREKLLHNC